MEDTQNDYIKFLFAKTQDKEYTLFETCFRQLDDSSQNSFFGLMAQKGYLIESMEQIPQDLEKIEFNLGNFLSAWDFKKANALIDKFLEKLASFRNNKEIVVNATGIASFTQNAEAHLKWIQNWKSSSTSVSDETDCVMLSSTYGEPNNLGGAKRILYGLVAHLKQCERLESVDILFANKKVRIQKNNESFDIAIEQL